MELCLPLNLYVEALPPMGLYLEMGSLGLNEDERPPQNLTVLAP